MTTEEYQELTGKIEAAKTNAYSFSSATYTASWNLFQRLRETLYGHPRLKGKSFAEIQSYETAMSAMMAVSYTPLAQLFDEMRAKVQDECVSFASGDESSYAEGMMPLEYSTGEMAGSIRSSFNPQALSFNVRAESDHYKWIHLGSPQQWTEGSLKSKYIAFTPVFGDTRDQGKTSIKKRKPSGKPEDEGKIVIRLSGPVLEKMQANRKAKGARPFIPVIMSNILSEYGPDGPQSQRVEEAIKETVSSFLRTVLQA
jgi:hypothetical protein